MTGPVVATNIGSWPGLDIGDAVRIAFAECPDLPYLPELPARGPHAGLVGRSTAVLPGLAADLQPAGWRLTSGSGREHRLAIATLRADLDHLEEHAQGYTGPVKLAFGGPWTLAASVERPRGDRVLADHGARRDLAQSLADGVADLVQELRRRLPDVAPVVQLDEPLLPAVLRGEVATASGFSRHRAVDLPEVSSTLSYVLDRVRAAGAADTAVHCCAAEPPVELLRGAGFGAVLVDVEQLGRAGWDAVGVVLEAGGRVGLGALPTGTLPTAPAADPDRIVRRVLAPVRALQLEPPALVRGLLLTPACGLASARPAQAVAALRALRRAGAVLAEQLLD